MICPPSTLSILLKDHKDYVCNIFRDIFSGTNSTFNSLIENEKYDWDTITEFPAE